MAALTTAMAASLVSPRADRARREWSSMTWKIVALRPAAMGHSVASICHSSFGAAAAKRL